MAAIYEEQMTIFLDFLGFSEASVQSDEAAQMQMLTLLTAISSMRSEFSDKSDPDTGSTRAIRLNPTITTFSDHIVASYPIGRLSGNGDESAKLSLAYFSATQLIAKIAAAALPFGFLIRGGLSYGKLYHSSGVVFGAAMIEAYNLESKSAIYPRVVVSPTLLKRCQSIALGGMVRGGHDGIGSVDYFTFLVGAGCPTGPEHHACVKAWFDTVVPIMKKNIAQLKDAGNLNALSKWVWFSKAFAETLRRTNPAILKASQISADDMAWAMLA